MKRSNRKYPSRYVSASKKSSKNYKDILKDIIDDRVDDWADGYQELEEAPELLKYIIDTYLSNNDALGVLDGFFGDDWKLYLEDEDED